MKSRKKSFIQMFCFHVLYFTKQSLETSAEKRKNVCAVTKESRHSSN